VPGNHEFLKTHVKEMAHLLQLHPEETGIENVHSINEQL